MNHVAIMNKSWGLLPKILSGEKTIESRFYKNRVAPWGKIKAGETVYFKNSGEPVTLRTKVEKIIQYEDLNPRLVKQLLENNYREIGISRGELKEFYRKIK